jgi:hypothetical protein
VTLAFATTPVIAQEEGEKELGWFYTAELGFTLAVIEAIIGQLFLIVTISRFVAMNVADSTWTAERQAALEARRILEITKAEDVESERPRPPGSS